MKVRKISFTQHDQPVRIPSLLSTPELSVGPFCVTRPNPTYQLTDPTRPNPIQLTTELAV